MAAIVEPLSWQESVASGFGATHKIRATYADFTAAAGATDTTVTLTPVTVAAGQCVVAAASKVVTAFVNSEAGVTSVALEVGDGGDVDRFLISTVVGEGTVATYKVTANSVATLPYAYTGADTIDLKLTVTGGTNNYVDTLTAGEVHVYLALGDLGDL